MIARLTWTLLMWRRHRGWRAHRATIRRVSRLSRRAFRAWQDRRTVAHLRWAGRSIPYFRDRIGLRTKLEELPVLTRADVQRHGEALRDPTRAPEALLRQTSGGSTGEPVVVFTDAAHRAWDVATEAHVLASWGLDPWCRTAVVWGADRELRALPARQRLWLRLLGRRTVDAFRLGEAEIAAAVRRLERARPVYVKGYATALDAVARWLLHHAPDHAIRPRVVRSTAEVLQPDVRDRLLEAFGGRVYDFYGSREVSSIAAECPAGSLHVQEHAKVVELVDEADAPVGPGVPGRLLVTDLRNRAFGMLRYDTGDVASWGPDEPCPCGSPYARLERLHGRTSDLIGTPAGERIHGEWFTHLFYGREGVQRFQVYQPSLERLEVRTVGPATEADLADLLETIRTRMGPAVDVQWQRVETIEPTPSGKRRFTISDVPYGPAAP